VVAGPATRDRVTTAEATLRETHRIRCSALRALDDPLKTLNTLKTLKTLDQEDADGFRR
jgi:hypothetical protein